MHVERRVIDNYQILAAATPAPGGGFIASVSVKVIGALPGDDLFANYRLADGFAFKSPEAALRYALNVGYGYLRGDTPTRH